MFINLLRHILIFVAPLFKYFTWIHGLLQKNRKCLEAEILQVDTNLPLVTDQTGGRDELDSISQRRLHADARQHHEGVLCHLHIFFLTPTGGTTVT